MGARTSQPYWLSTEAFALAKQRWSREIFISGTGTSNFYSADDLQLQWDEEIDEPIYPKRPQTEEEIHSVTRGLRIFINEDPMIAIAAFTLLEQMDLTTLKDFNHEGAISHSLRAILEGASKHVYFQDIANQQQTAALEAALQEKQAALEENRILKEQLQLTRQEQFGTSSEQASQVLPELPAASTSVEDAKDDTAPDQGKKPRAVKNAGRKPIPAHLPREDVVCDLAVEQKKCDQCEAEMQFVGDEFSERVDIIPAKLIVKRYITKKYVCRCCNKFVAARAPRSVIPGSSYGSAGLLADMVINKFQFALPFYRMEQVYSRAGHAISRTTMANLMITLADSLTPLVERFREHLLRQPIIHADETTFQVLKELGRAAQSKSYMWQYCSATHAAHQLVIFDYQTSRAGAHALKFLTHPDETAFSGYLQVDGYAGYNVIESATRVGCMAHVRRKFVEVVQAVPAAQASESLATKAIGLIQQLYLIEGQLTHATIAQRLSARRLHSVPVLNQFKAWLDMQAQEGMRKTLLGKAVHYALGQWKYIIRYAEDGGLNIDNNIAERNIKSFVIGRKNWLFADSVDGGHATAVLTTMVRSALANKLDAYQYMVHVLEQLPYAQTEDDFQALMPWNVAAQLGTESLPQRLVA